MPTIKPHINFNGNAGEAFEFYRSVFGGEFSNLVRFKDMPGLDHISASDGHLIMHISLPIGSNNELMGNDVPPSMGVVNEREHRSNIVYILNFYFIASFVITALFVSKHKREDAMAFSG